MSGPTVGGGTGGDLFGNIFGGGKQVYPPLGPGWKYVDMNIPVAPPGYTVARMSQIANNQSTPAMSPFGLGGNASLLGRGAGFGGRSAVYGYTDPHSPQGLAIRDNQKIIDRVRVQELRGLVAPGTTDALLAGKPLPGGGAIPGVTLPGVTGATGVTVTNAGAPQATATGAPQSLAQVVANNKLLASNKKPINPFERGTTQWYDFNEAQKALAAQGSAEAKTRMGIGTPTTATQQILDYMKTHGGGGTTVTPPAATPPAVATPTVNQPTAPTPVANPPPTSPNAAPQSPPPSATSGVKTENIPNMTPPTSGPAAAPPAGATPPNAPVAPTSAANPAEPKKGYIDATLDVLGKMWGNVTGATQVPLVPANPQQYDPLSGAQPPGQ